MAVQSSSVLNVSDDTAAGAAIALLIHYFDLAPASAQLLVKKWRHQYPVSWTRAAVTEALYQGRYKPISVEQILAFWQRRGRTIPHFNAEFEAIIAVPLQQEFESWEAANAVSPALTPRPGSTQASHPENGPADHSGGTATPAIASQAAIGIAPAAPLRPRLKLPGERPRPNKTGFEALLEPPASLGHPGDFGPAPADQLQITQGPDPANLAQAKAQQFQPPPIGRFVPAQDDSGFSSRLRAVAEQINGDRPWLQAAPTARSAGANDSEAAIPDLATPEGAELNLTDLELAAPGLAASELAVPNLATPDLATPDLAAPEPQALEPAISHEAQLPPLPSPAMPEAIALAVEELLMQQATSPQETRAESTPDAAEPSPDSSPCPWTEDDAGAIAAAALATEAIETQPRGDLSLDDDLAPGDLAHPDFAALDAPVPASDSESPHLEESLSLASAPTDSAPIDSPPVDLAPVDSAPVDSAPVDSASLEPTRLEPLPDSSGPQPDSRDLAPISELLASLVQRGDGTADGAPGIAPE